MLFLLQLQVDWLSLNILYGILGGITAGFYFWLKDDYENNEVQ
jgi:hypothetical protein